MSGRNGSYALVITFRSGLSQGLEHIQGSLLIATRCDDEYLVSVIRDGRRRARRPHTLCSRTNGERTNQTPPQSIMLWWLIGILRVQSPLDGFPPDGSLLLTSGLSDHIGPHKTV